MSKIGPSFRLLEKPNETVNLAVLDGAHAVYVQQVEGRHMMRAFTRIGARAPLYCTGVGKILLAWKSPEEVREILAEEEFRSFTPNTIVGLSEFEKELQRVRNAGYAVDNEERELGVRCVTVPVRNHTGEVAAALSMSAPAARLSDSRTVEVYQQIRLASDEIASRAGWR